VSESLLTRYGVTAPARVIGRGMECFVCFFVGHRVEHPSDTTLTYCVFLFFFLLGFWLIPR
jgi:hypothetical protein